MSREFTVDVTVTLGDDETDVEARAHVLVDEGLGMGGSWGAACDGDIEIRIGNDDFWLDAAAHLSPADLEAVEDALCELAMSDHREVA